GAAAAEGSATEPPGTGSAQGAAKSPRLNVTVVGWTGHTPHAVPEAQRAWGTGTGAGHWDPEAGELGLAAVPGRQAAFRQGLAAAVQYARAVGCPRIHLMAGRVPPGTDRAAVAGEMETTFIENLKYAADLLAQEDMIGLVEPINNRITDPSYYLNTPHQGKAAISPQSLLQRRRSIPTAPVPSLGHIQIAQVPGRHEPDSPGELNFPYIFELLESLGYTGYVGCEYAPKGDTLEGLGWLRSYWESRGLQHGGTSKAAN
uniref:Hydroxypyruvate isomerase (putative) n=1 Tax=Otus sunia TaxID=257818 RepID=A0A8C8B7B0_9STRI